MPHESFPLNEQPSPQELLAPEFEYRMLTGHRRSDGSFKSTEQLQTQYVRLTDELVHQMVDGVEVIDYETGEKSIRKVDTVVWLDKSARPLAWLTKDLWPLLAADSDGNVPPQPDFKFVNIDRNQWTSSIDPEGKGVSDIENIDNSVIRSLRSIFLKNAGDRKKDLTETIDTAPTQLDGKTVLIVDEVVATGRTLDYATKFFERAFPEARIAGTHWMKGVAANKTGGVGNADLPVWYRDDTPYGRGIGNRNIDASLSSPNSTQRLGAWFLSAALRHRNIEGERVPDRLSVQLRSELHQLAEDTKNGKVFIEPSRLRDIDDAKERALRYNQLDSLQEYMQQKRTHAA